MSRQHERDEFITIVAQEGLSLNVTRKLLRYSATLQRLAEAQCNGDWPFDNGERVTKQCARCQMGWVPSSLVRESRKPGAPLICRDCRTTDLVKALLPVGFAAIFAGDPRGCVLKLTVPSGRTNDWGKEGVCVP